MKVGRQILWNCYTNLRNDTDLLSWWEDAPVKDDWGNHLKDRLFHVGSLIDVSPYYFEGPVKNPSIWKESLTCIVPLIRSLRGENLER